MNNELLLRHPSTVPWHSAHCCLAVWNEQKPISSDDNHVIQCFAALYLREKAAFQCRSGTGEYLFMSETQQEAEILPGWLFYSALYPQLCSGPAVHWGAEDCYCPNQNNSPFADTVPQMEGEEEHQDCFPESTCKAEVTHCYLDQWERGSS